MMHLILTHEYPNTVCKKFTVDNCNAKIGFSHSNYSDIDCPICKIEADKIIENKKGGVK